MRLALWLSSFFVLVIFAPVTLAKTINVPEDIGTIQSAVDAASAGDTIKVAAGTYAENIVFKRSINLRGAGASTTLIRAADASSDVLTVTADWVNISGFKITGARENHAGIYIGDADHSNISSNDFSNNDIGIHLLACSNIVLSSNVASNSNYYGIYIHSSFNNTLSDNIASNNKHYGIYLRSSSDNTLSNNVASDNSRWDFHAEQQSVNNTVVHLTMGKNIVSFTGKDVSVKSASLPAADPSRLVNIGRFLEVTGNSADSKVHLNLSYSNTDIAGLDESTLKMWKYDGSWWQVSGSGVDMANDYVYASIASFGIFAPMAMRQVATPAPAPTMPAPTTAPQIITPAPTTPAPTPEPTKGICGPSVAVAIAALLLLLSKMKDLKLPHELRGIFRKPFGELYRGEGLKPAQQIKSRLRGEKVIIVGDMTLKNMLAVGIKPSLAVVDLKTKRSIEMPAVENVFEAKNPPGMITQDLWNKIHEAIEKDGSVVLVEGEEDLAVLPCILEADWDAVVLYGQPDEGIVFIKVTEDKKTEAGMILKFLKKVV